ncbi:calcium-binding protein [Nonomuraea polychroma]|uniref:calcium-binding protein n=1 Tax=Nonomuraea polychroma TaxID=46176 RepID=UPI001F4E765B|nr:calcium-binding protein [Nonomuraea polychroma]
MTRHPSDDHLDELIEQVIVDAYDDDERLSGFHVMIGDNLAVPFETTVLGLQVTVAAITSVISYGDGARRLANDRSPSRAVSPRAVWLESWTARQQSP